MCVRATHTEWPTKPLTPLNTTKQDPYSLPALLALGVSYVNELDSVRALQNLKAWVEHNPKYQVTITAVCQHKTTGVLKHPSFLAPLPSTATD